MKLLDLIPVSIKAKFLKALVKNLRLAIKHGEISDLSYTASPIGKILIIKSGDGVTGNWQPSYPSTNSIPNKPGRLCTFFMEPETVEAALVALRDDEEELEPVDRIVKHLEQELPEISNVHGSASEAVQSETDAVESVAPATQLLAEADCGFASPSKLLSDDPRSQPPSPAVACEEEAVFELKRPIIADEEDVLAKLTEMHLEKSTDPETLYQDFSFNFDPNHKDISRLTELKNKLFVIYRQKHAPWATPY